MRKIPPAVRYEDGLHEDLRNPREAAHYLNAAFKGGDPDVILLAMHDIAKARGMTRVARTLEVHRVSLHKMLRRKGNPGFRVFLELMGEFEVQLSASPRRRAIRA